MENYKSLLVSGNLKCKSGLSSQSGITVDGPMLVHKSTQVGPLLVSGSAHINNGMKVYGGTTLMDTLFVSGDAAVATDLLVSGDLTTTRLAVLGNTCLQNTQCAQSLLVSGDTTLQANLYVARQCTVEGRLVVEDGLKVNESVTLQQLYVDRGLEVKGDSLLRNVKILGRTTLHDELVVSGNVILAEDTQCQDLQAEDLTCHSLHVKKDTILHRNLTISGHLATSSLHTTRTLETDSNCLIHGNLTTQGSSHLQAVTATTATFSDTAIATNLVAIDNVSSQNMSCNGIKVQNELCVPGKAKVDKLTVRKMDGVSLATQLLTAINLTTNTLTARGESTMNRVTIADDLAVRGSIVTHRIVPSTGETLVVGGPKDKMQVDRIYTRYIDGIRGRGVTITTSVNVLGELNAEKIGTPLQNGVVGRFHIIVPLPDSDTITIGSANNIVKLASPLHVDTILPTAENSSIHYGRAACNNVFEERISVPTVYTSHLRGTGRDGVVDVKPNLSVLGYSQLERVRSSGRCGDVLKFENSHGQMALSIGMKMCTGPKKEQDKHVTTIEAASRLDVDGGKSKTVRVYDKMQTSSIHPLPGTKLHVQANHVCTDRVQPSHTTTLSYLSLIGKKRAQWDLTGPGAILQTTDGGNFTLKARGGQVVVASPMQCGDIIPQQDAVHSIGSPEHRLQRVAAVDVTADVVRSDVLSSKEGTSAIQLQAGERKMTLDDDQHWMQMSTPSLCIQSDVRLSGRMKVIDRMKCAHLQCSQLETSQIQPNPDGDINFIGQSSIHFDLKGEHPRLHFPPSQHLDVDGESLHLHLPTFSQDIVPDTSNRQLGSDSMRYEKIYIGDIDMTGDLTVPTLYITELHGTHQDGLHIGTNVVAPSIQVDEVRSDTVISPIIVTNKLDMDTQLVIGECIGIEKDAESGCSVIQSLAGSDIQLRTGRKVELETTEDVDTVTLTSKDKELDIHSSTGIHLTGSKVMCDNVLTVNTVHSSCIQHPEGSGCIHIGQDVVSIPNLTVDELKSQNLDTDTLKTSHIISPSSVLSIGGAMKWNLDGPTVELDVGRLSLDIHASDLRLPPTAVDGTLHVQDIECGSQLQIGRFSIHPGYQMNSPTTLSADDAQSIVVDTYELKLVHNLSVDGTVVADRIWPKSSCIRLGKSDTVVDIPHLLQVGNGLVVNHITSNTDSVICSAPHIQLNQMTVDVDGNITVPKMMTGVIETSNLVLQDTGAGPFLSAKYERDACRLNSFGKQLVFESSQVRAIHDFHVQGVLSCSGRIDCSNVSSRVLRVDQLDQVAGKQQSPIQVICPIQCKSGIEGVDNVLTINDKLYIDTNSINPCIRSSGGLRLTTDGPMVAVERTLRTQDMVPDLTGKRDIGKEDKVYNKVWTDVVSSPSGLVLHGDQIQLDSTELVTTGDKPLTIRSSGIMNDIVLAPGSSLVVVEDDLYVKGSLRVNQIEPDLGKELKVYASDLVVVQDHPSPPTSASGLQQLQSFQPGEGGFQNKTTWSASTLLPILVQALQESHNINIVPEATNNADAAGKGVAVGGYYRLPGDPAILCMRTS